MISRRNGLSNFRSSLLRPRRFFSKPLSFCIYMYPSWSMRKIMNISGIQCLLWTRDCDEIRRTNHLLIESQMMDLSVPADSPFQVKAFHWSHISKFSKTSVLGCCILKSSYVKKMLINFFKVLVDWDKFSLELGLHYSLWNEFPCDVIDAKRFGEIFVLANFWCEIMDILFCKEKNVNTIWY